MRTIALALLVSLPCAAQDVPPAVEVYEGLFTPADDRGVELHVKGGAYLPPERLLATGKELVRLRAENASLRESVSSVPIWVWSIAGAVVGAGTTFAIIKLSGR